MSFNVLNISESSSQSNQVVEVLEVGGDHLSEREMVPAAVGDITTGETDQTTCYMRLILK